MNEIGQEHSAIEQTRIIEAMEANFAEEMACMARAVPDGELHEDAEMRWFFTGRPGFNGVLRTSLSIVPTKLILMAGSARCWLIFRSEKYR